MISVLFLIMALQNLGVELLPLIAGLGVAGAGIALAMQGVLGNLFAGLTIILTKPFRIGEYIEIAGEEGTVESISLFQTTLAHPDRSRVVIPNRKIVGEILHNFGKIRQVNVVVGVAYDTDLNRAIALIQQTLRANARVLRDIEPRDRREPARGFVREHCRQALGCGHGLRLSLRVRSTRQSSRPSEMPASSFRSRSARFEWSPPPEAAHPGGSTGLTLGVRESRRRDFRIFALGQLGLPDTSNQDDGDGVLNQIDDAVGDVEPRQESPIPRVFLPATSCATGCFPGINEMIHNVHQTGSTTWVS